MTYCIQCAGIHSGKGISVHLYGTILKFIVIINLHNLHNLHGHNFKRAVTILTNQNITTLGVSLQLES